MFDHVGLKVKDYKRSKAFFEKALAPLGLKLLAEYDGSSAGFGSEKYPAFWISEGSPSPTGVHVAFASSSRSKVGDFHAAALKAGGRDNGAPGIREPYGPTYYAAFVFDPDGNNIEAVCHAKK